MNKSSAPDTDRYRIAAQNRKARHDFFIEETIEAGVVLTGTEVKSLRQGRAQLSDAYAVVRGTEMFLQNAHISEYAQQAKGTPTHEAKRPRKLLMHRNQLNKLKGAIHKEGMTAVPLQIHFNDRGIAKVLLGLAKGKRKEDKREAIKQREWDRQKQRIMKNNNRE